MKALSDFYGEYKKNVRPFWREEPFDYVVYRPLAFLVVKGTYGLPLAPNHFSLLALLTALVSGLCLATGTPVGFFCGGIGIFLFGVWDCCDGMLARMKGNGDRYGQFVDMFVDVLSSLCFYGGLAWGLKKTGVLYPWLALLSGIAVCFHAGIYNFYKKQFFFYEAGNPRGRRDEIDELKKDLGAIGGGGGNLVRKVSDSILFAFCRSSGPVQFAPVRCGGLCQKQQDDPLSLELHRRFRTSRPFVPVPNFVEN